MRNQPCVSEDSRGTHPYNMQRSSPWARYIDERTGMHLWYDGDVWTDGHTMWPGGRGQQQGQMPQMKNANGTSGNGMLPNGMPNMLQGGHQQYMGDMMVGPGGQMMSSSQLMTPNDQTMAPNGQMMGPNGQIMGVNGQVIGPNGQMVGPNGQIVGPSGQMVGPNGQMTRSVGQMMGHNGQIMGPSGQVINRVQPPNDKPRFLNSAVAAGGALVAGVLGGAALAHTMQANAEENIQTTAAQNTSPVYYQTSGTPLVGQREAQPRAYLATVPGTYPTVQQPRQEASVVVYPPAATLPHAGPPGYYENHLSLKSNDNMSRGQPAVSIQGASAAVAAVVAADAAKANAASQNQRQITLQRQIVQTQYAPPVEPTISGSIPGVTVQRGNIKSELGDWQRHRSSDGRRFFKHTLTGAERSSDAFI